MSPGSLVMWIGEDRSYIKRGETRQIISIELGSGMLWLENPNNSGIFKTSPINVKLLSS